MDIKYLQIFIIAILVLVIAGFLLKSFAKLVFIGIVIFILFSLGFIWGPTDLNEKLGLNKVVSENSMEKINDVSKTIEEKREENAVIPKEDLEKAQGTVKDKTKEAFNFSLNKFKEGFGKAKDYFNKDEGQEIEGNSNSNTE